MVFVNFTVGISRSSPPEVFLGNSILKICSKFIGERPWQSVISIKLLYNFIEIALWYECSPAYLLHFFRTTFYKNTFRGLLLYRFQSVWNGSGNCKITSLQENILHIWILSEPLFSKLMTQKFLGPCFKSFVVLAFKKFVSLMLQSKRSIVPGSKEKYVHQTYFRIHWIGFRRFNKKQKSVWSNVFWYVKVCIFWKCIQYKYIEAKHKCQKSVLRTK